MAERLGYVSMEARGPWRARSCRVGTLCHGALESFLEALASTRRATSAAEIGIIVGQKCVTGSEKWSSEHDEAERRLG